MAIECSKSELINLLQAKSVGATKIMAQGLEFDSRLIKGGEIFVALPGENTHGERFLQSAFDRGAALMIVEEENLLKTFIEPERLIVVKDSLKAFQALAAWWRKKLQIPVLAITGSVGKTTVKELAAGILLQASLGNYSKKSFNNHVGVPYSICQTAPRHQWLILEMGMNSPGELKLLSELAEPDVAVISKISPAHIGRLGSMEAIAAAKLEILSGLKPAGTFISNLDDEFFQQYLQNVKLPAGIKHLRFGHSPEADLQITEAKVCENLHLSITLKELQGAASHELQVAILGLHNAGNVAVAVLAAQSLLPAGSLDFAAIAHGLRSYVAPEGRLKLRYLPAKRVIVDDSYNANPDSMSAMLTLAANISEQQQRVGLVLGDMLEMGAKSADYHLGLLPHILAAKPAFVVLVGTEVKLLELPLREQGLAVSFAETPESAAHLLHKLDFNYLLIKASHGIGLDRTVNKLIEIEGEVLAPPESEKETDSDSDLDSEEK